MSTEIPRRSYQTGRICRWSFWKKCCCWTKQILPCIWEISDNDPCAYAYAEKYTKLWNTHTHTHTHIRITSQVHTNTHTLSSLNSRKGYLQEEVPGYVGAYTQTNTNTRLPVPDRARRITHTHTHTLSNTHTHTHTLSNTNTLSNTHTFEHTHTNTHTCTHAHTHTHFQVSGQEKGTAKTRDRTA